MPQYDDPVEVLRRQRPSSEPPPDLREFWTRTLKESRDLASPPTLTLVGPKLRHMEIHDVTFAGFGGEPVHAWLQRPSGVREDLPIIVWYHGYSDGRELSHVTSVWLLAGYAVLSVDTRGQTGTTSDYHGSGPAFPGFMTRGVHDPDSYYFRRVYTDSVLAIDAAKQLPGVDGDRVIAAGSSQGGGLCLAVAGLRDDLQAVMSNVPFLCDFPRAVAMAPEGPYLEVVEYLRRRRNDVDSVFRTLSYFDVAHLVLDATAPALMSVALMDTLVPPSTVYAAYNCYGGAKKLVEYPFNDHLAGQEYQELEELEWLARHVPLA